TPPSTTSGSIPEISTSATSTLDESGSFSCVTFSKNEPTDYAGFRVICGGFDSKFFHSHRALARCQARGIKRNRFHGFPAFQPKPLKRFLNKRGLLSTGLKPGVNEKDF